MVRVWLRKNRRWIGVWTGRIVLEDCATPLGKCTVLPDMFDDTRHLVLTRRLALKSIFFLPSTRMSPC
jgi:hypothetical protein